MTDPTAITPETPLKALAERANPPENWWNEDTPKRSELELPGHILQALGEAGIHTVAQLRATGPTRLRKLPYIGKLAYQQIVDLLRGAGSAERRRPLMAMIRDKNMSDEVDLMRELVRSAIWDVAYQEKELRRAHKVVACAKVLLGRCGYDFTLEEAIETYRDDEMQQDNPDNPTEWAKAISSAVLLLVMSITSEALQTARAMR